MWHTVSHEPRWSAEVAVAVGRRSHLERAAKLSVTASRSLNGRNRRRDVLMILADASARSRPVGSMRSPRRLPASLDHGSQLRCELAVVVGACTGTSTPSEFSGTDTARRRLPRRWRRCSGGLAAAPCRMSCASWRRRQSALQLVGVFVVKTYGRGGEVVEDFALHAAARNTMTGTLMKPADAGCFAYSRLLPCSKSCKHQLRPAPGHMMLSGGRRHSRCREGESRRGLDLRCDF